MHDLYAHQGLNSFFQLHQAVDEVLFYSMYILFSPVGYNMFSYTQRSPKLYSRDHYKRVPFFSEGGKQL